MRILVTGGNGYVGSQVVADLLALGHKVSILERFLWPEAREGAYEFIERDFELVDKALEGAEAIIHLAGIVSESECQKVGWETTYRLNALFTRLIASKTNVPLSFASSGQVYGNTHGCIETTPTPLSELGYYAWSKVIAEGYLLTRPKTTIYRMGTVFGRSPNMKKWSLVNKMTLDAINRGIITITGGIINRSLVSVQDASKFYIQAVLEPPEGQIIKNLASIPAISSLDLATIISHFTGAEVQFKGDNSQISGYTYLKATEGTNPKALISFIEAEKLNGGPKRS